MTLEASILKAGLAVSTTPENDLKRAGRLSCLGEMLSDRYKRTGNMPDLEAAISKLELAISITPGTILIEKPTPRALGRTNWSLLEVQSYCACSLAKRDLPQLKCKGALLFD